MSAVPEVWDPLFVLPNIDMQVEVEAGGIAIVSARDARVQRLADAHPSFKHYLDSFATEFGDRCFPSIMLRHPSSRPELQLVAPLAAFRDTLAISTIPVGWANTLCHDGNWRIRYANSFSFYPWVIGKNFTDITTMSIAQRGWHVATKLHGQTTPGFSPMTVTSSCIDRPLLTELLVRWEHCFSTTDPAWEYRALFRSLNMAFAAAMQPGNVEVTIYDIGRAIALWVSALEILAHSGTFTGLPHVIRLLEKNDWRLSECSTAQYKVYPYKDTQPLRSLPYWICGELFNLRNVFVHGKPLEDERLIVAPGKRPLNLYASLIFRMALAGFLGLHPPPVVREKDETEYDALMRSQFRFRAYQREIELALSTVLLTEEEYRRERNTLPTGQ